MIRHFIALETFTHQMDCFCPSNEKVDFFHIHRADVMEITEERKFVIGSGWYYLILINDERRFYVAYEDIQQYVLNGQLLSMVDIELEMNYLVFQVNRSLDNNDEMSFGKYAEKLRESKTFKEKLENYITHAAVQ